MSEEVQDTDEQKLYTQYCEALKAIQLITPHVTIHIGVGETASVIGALQLALRYPGFTGPSAKCAKVVCDMLIEALAIKDERIRPILLMGYDRKFDR